MANETRFHMIEVTARLLRQRGYHGTSLSDILSASGAPRGSLYFHFPGGKDQLVVEVTRASVDGVTRELRKVLAVEKNPGAAVRRIIEATARMLRECDFALGCPVAPIVLDATKDVPELLEVCREAFRSWIGSLSEAFADAGIPERRARSLALLVESSIEGLMIISRATRDDGPLTAVADELAALVESAVSLAKRRKSMSTNALHDPTARRARPRA
jgi:TetR/AcrR family transcriptional repressor of lmrAB and yxaGH operons